MTAYAVGVQVKTGRCCDGGVRVTGHPEWVLQHQLVRQRLLPANAVNAVGIGPRIRAAHI
jgi:hypothetical protein